MIDDKYYVEHVINVVFRACFGGWGGECRGQDTFTTLSIESLT